MVKLLTGIIDFLTLCPQLEQSREVNLGLTETTTFS